MSFGAKCKSTGNCPSFPSAEGGGLRPTVGHLTVYWRWENNVLQMEYAYGSVASLSSSMGYRPWYTVNCEERRSYWRATFGSWREGYSQWEREMPAPRSGPRGRAHCCRVFSSVFVSYITLFILTVLLYYCINCV